MISLSLALAKLPLAVTAMEVKWHFATESRYIRYAISLGH